MTPRAIEWRRVIDINDRSLRNVVVGLGERIDGVPRQTGFDITSASEIMVILSLATSFKDLRERLAKIVVGLNYDGEAVTAADLKADGALAVILADAINPNLLQNSRAHSGAYPMRAPSVISLPVTHQSWRTMLVSNIRIT